MSHQTTFLNNPAKKSNFIRFQNALTLRPGGVRQKVKYAGLSTARETFISGTFRDQNIINVSTSELELMRVRFRAYLFFGYPVRVPGTFAKISKKWYIRTVGYHF